MLRFCILIVGLSLLGVGCQTTHSRDVALVEQRVSQLKSLSRYSSTICEIETRPTRPALARYLEMHPKESNEIREGVWTFKWWQTESRCEIRSNFSSAVGQLQKGIVEAALCLPLQVFFVNSPFDEVQITPKSVRRKGSLIQIHDNPNSDLGYFLDPGNTTIRTKTQSRGELSAHYALIDGEWLPDDITQTTEALKIHIDEIRYSDMKVGPRRMLDSLWISVGTDMPRRHSQILVRNCEKM